jgi:hypothetical protein
MAPRPVTATSIAFCGHINFRSTQHSLYVLHKSPLSHPGTEKPSSESPMSTYTPCFPPTDVPLSGRLRPISSTSSGASTSGSHSPPEVSYSTRLSRSHLALASVSEYFPRPPSPTSAAVDIKRVTHLRRKFRLAIDATYRDTSSGKWAHVSEMAKLGSTRGRWQGMCSGSNAPYSLYKAHKQNHQGE